MKIYLSILLILTSFIACSSGVNKYQKKDDLPKNVRFYSEEDMFKIPLCEYNDSLCSNPDDCSVTDYNSLLCDPLTDEISKTLSEVGSVVGEITMSGHEWHKLYVIYDKNNGYLFMMPNRNPNKKINKIKRTNYNVIITGEVNGVKIDIDLNNAQLSNNGHSLLFLITIKNTLSNNITFNTSTDIIHLLFGNKKNKIESQLEACNYCSQSSKNFVQEIIPGEEKEFFAKLNFKNENESAGIQMGLIFTKMMIDGLNKSENNSESTDLNKIEKQILDTWGGDIQFGRNGNRVPLTIKINFN